ncbi:MAG TPA: GtrA family protein [Thermoflexales bacterium]|jgi:putative flippase GtrA|nr:GtrA family protein [Thermoflexales bacterium]HQX12292.1 GtrA family protein [Thermoflexales bacterium]HQY26005.1 GtrA family protein [Thermoflexales bacterium]HQZ54327.1 GtrA family protein [Thermoflexales bacterium]HRA55192.1 GtrA family protein [Thermoflexales bacterium]
MKILQSNKPEVQRFIKFAVTGGVGLVIDYIVLNILAHVFDVPSPIAIAVAFVCAALNNFIWNRLWVYPESRSQPKRKLLPVFMAVNAMGLGINELTLLLLEAPLSALFGSAFLGLNVTKAIGAGIVMIWNFVVNRLVTFRSVKWGTAGATGTSDPGEIDSAL